MIASAASTASTIASVEILFECFAPARVRVPGALVCAVPSCPSAPAGGGAVVAVLEEVVVVAVAGAVVVVAGEPAAGVVAVVAGAVATPAAEGDLVAGTPSAGEAVFGAVFVCEEVVGEIVVGVPGLLVADAVAEVVVSLAEGAAASAANGVGIASASSIAVAARTRL